MDREKFAKKMKNASPDIDMSYIDSVIKASLSPEGEFCKGFKNLIVVNEEFAECQQEVSKFMRGKFDRIGLIEETADVLIGIRCIQFICGVSDEELKKAINIKIQRENCRNRNDIRVVDTTKKSNIKCEHCTFYATEQCKCTDSPHFGKVHYWNRCKWFEWHPKYLKKDDASKK